jgi:hypothetical protein
LICFSPLEGVQELDVSLVVRLLGWFICLLGCGSLYFVPCFSFSILRVLWLIYGVQGFIICCHIHVSTCLWIQVVWPYIKHC